MTFNLNTKTDFNCYIFNQDFRLHKCGCFSICRKCSTVGYIWQLQHVATSVSEAAICTELSLSIKYEERCTISEIKDVCLND